MRNVIAQIVCVACFCCAAHAGTVRVPADQPTIQAGLDVALTGDTVLVEAGTYTGVGNRDLDFGGRNIVLKSEFGPALTVIDCGGTSGDNHRGFWFHNGENATAVVEGFTVTNGYAEDGGGFSCVNSSPTIRGNTVTSCRAVHYGAGIHCVYSTSQILGNSIVDNTGSNIGGDGGGGISLIYCNNVLIADNTISGNFSYSGGGIDCFDARAIIRHNRIEDNLAYGGAAIGLCCGSLGTIDSNTIIGNMAYDLGGAIYCNSGSYPTISNNVILGNMASSAYSYGGGICCNESDPDIVGNTIVRNAAANGGGLALINHASPLVHGNIIALSGSGGAVTAEVTASPDFAHCDLWGNNGGDWAGSIAGYLGVDGNVSVDPMFCDVDNDDYHLSSFSPCAPGVYPNVELIGALGVSCDPFLCGDCNTDGVVDTLDLNLLKDFYFGGSTVWPYPLGSGDLNCDGSVMINDLILLAGYIYGYGPPTCCVPEPRPVHPGRHEIR